MDGFESEAPVRADVPRLFDLADRDPYQAYERLRIEEPVRWDDGIRGWLVSRYADVAFVFRSDDLFHFPNDLPGSEEVLHGRRGIFMLDGDLHRDMHNRLGRFVRAFVTPAYRREVLRNVVAYQVDSFATRGVAELATEFADQIPIRVIASLLGLPWQEDAVFNDCKVFVDDIMRWNETYGLVPEVQSAARRSAAGLASVLLPVIRDRRDRPQDDLLSACWAAGNANFADWDEQDMLAYARLLLAAGIHTTGLLICNLLFMLLDNDTLRMTVMADPAKLLGPLVEEVLRLFPSVHISARVAVRATEIGGQAVAAGDRIYVLTAAANRDHTQYQHADSVDLAGPGGHLAFGIGPRFCIGAPLARAEAFEAISELMARLPDIRLDRVAPPAQFGGLRFRAHRPLHAAFTPFGAAATPT